MASRTACPPEELLAELADGTLQELPTLLLVQHLRRCPACQMRLGQHVAVARWVAARWGEAPSVAPAAAAEAAGEVVSEVASQAVRRVAGRMGRQAGDERAGSREAASGPAGLWRQRALAALGAGGRLARRMLAGSWGMATGAVRAAARTRGLVDRLASRWQQALAPSPASLPSPPGRPFARLAPFAGLAPGMLWTLPWRASAWMVPGAREGRRSGSEGARRWAPA